MLLLFLCLANPSNCYAYLDPGSGGILIQLLFGGLAGAIAIIKLYWHKIKDFFKKK